MKPMLASNWDPDKVTFPVLAQPKVDGVRALNLSGRLTGRSLKRFKNSHVTDFFSSDLLIGFDGEMAAESEVHPSLCRLTTQALGTINGEPWIMWWLFDFVTTGTRDLPYRKRYELLQERVAEVRAQDPRLGSHLSVMPSIGIGNQGDLQAQEEEWLDAGYEGVILRGPSAPYKSGRSTVKEGGLLRIKSFLDFEFVIDNVNEGETNNNVATTNELGYTERSTHQDNMIPNGMIGSLEGRIVENVNWRKQRLFNAGDSVKVGAGRLTHDERRYYFENQDEIVGKIGKAKMFPSGIKDKARFPTFQSFRDKEDM